MKISLAFVHHLHAVLYLKTVSYQKITFWESLVWGSRLPWYHLVSEFISSLNIGRCEFDQEIIFVYEIWRFMYVSFEALYKIQFWTSCIHLTHFSKMSCLSSPIVLCQGMWSGVFTYGIPTNILCAFTVFCGIFCMYCHTILLYLIHHHHHVPEGLGVFPVPWSSRWSWSLHLFLARPMFLRPFGLYCSACFGSLFVSILCTCCSHFW